MEKILGIDTGTNSLGWAIVEKDDEGYRLVDKGTNIFAEGVKIEKGIESSKASERTEHRSTRKHYWRRKIRKIRLLTILSENHLCPPLSKTALREWRLKKVYPKDELFMEWQRTDDTENKNPYRFRYMCLKQKLDLTDISQRYILGRALYHLNQRRGFLSGRKDGSKETEGTVKKDIESLSQEMADYGCKYLGEYFFFLYEKGEKIRNHYTSRKEHYLEEFHAICKMQELEPKLVEQLERAIFFQRPLKSQKGLVGTCTFEKGKARCSVSHPLFEEFRMYSFINNIKIQTPADSDLRYLTQEEKERIIPKFLRKSKSTFTFEDIAKELAGKKNYCYYKDKEEKPYKFNYYMDTSISGCEVTAHLVDIFGENWLDNICEVYTLAEDKSRFEIMNDIWHALFFYDDEDKLMEFAKDRLQLDEEQAKKFSKIPVPGTYASLSLKAIRKILPYMRDYGMIYSKAVFMANLCEVLPSHIWGIKETREAAIENVLKVVEGCADSSDERTLETCVKDYLKERYRVDDATLNKLYHPSMIDLYPRVKPNDEGIYQLGSPRISSVRNPMAMHSLFRMRKVINLMLKEGKIDENTKIHIEFARDLNDANKRAAIKQWQRENERMRADCRKKIAEYIEESKITDTDILKYQLWEEQGHKCLYTGEEIGITDFLGANPKYDIEHTIPRSAGGDSTKENLTLCSSRYNRDVKKTKIPAELPEHEAILQRIEAWKEQYEDLEKQMRKRRTNGSMAKDQKDRIIQSRHLLKLKRDYWKGKYERFTMKQVPEGFSRRQGTDISVISRYARLYLKSVFKSVYIVKGIATADFRKAWGIQDEYEKKSRDNHAHHCIDAITIACIGKNEYDQLAQYYHQQDDNRYYGKAKPHFDAPWPTFAEDIRKIHEELLIAHYTRDNMPKQSRKRVATVNGKKIYAQGDTARASLHNDTYYGAIDVDGEVKYVGRKSLDSLTEKDIESIVDNVVRQKVKDAVAAHEGSLKKAIEAGIWMNEEKRIPIKKVRCYVKQVKPLEIRKHRDLSRHEYKQHYLAWNDSNYLVAVYIGKDSKGKEKREFEEVNMKDAAAFYKRSNNKTVADNQIVPLFSKNGYPLVYKLKIGTMVILYDHSPEEIWDADRNYIQKRLYKITGMSLTNRRMVVVHHQEARQATEIKQEAKAYGYDGDLRPMLRISFNQFKALVQDVDFEINDLGEIKRLI